MNKYVSKFILWLRFGLMIYVVMFLLNVWGEFNSPSIFSMEVQKNSSYHCYANIYNHSASPQYSAFICTNPSKYLSILRVYPTKPITFTVNSIGDIVIFALLIISGVVSWVLFFVKVIKNYVPWL
jgi:hypothetical protein